jgi:hypothetical protein
VPLLPLVIPAKVGIQTFVLARHSSAGWNPDLALLFISSKALQETTRFQLALE